MAFYEDTQFLTNPTATPSNLLPIRPDTTCLRGAPDSRQDMDLYPASTLRTAAEMEDDFQPTAMSCVGRQAATRWNTSASSQRLEGEDAGLLMASGRMSSAQALEEEFSGESDSP